MTKQLLIIRALHKGFPPLDPDLLFVSDKSECATCFTKSKQMEQSVFG